MALPHLKARRNFQEQSRRMPTLSVGKKLNRMFQISIKCVRTKFIGWRGFQQQMLPEGVNLNPSHTFALATEKCGHTHNSLPTLAACEGSRVWVRYATARSAVPRGVQSRGFHLWVSSRETSVVTPPFTKLPLSHSKKAVWLRANVPFNMALESVVVGFVWNVWLSLWMFMSLSFLECIKHGGWG